MGAEPLIVNAQDELVEQLAHPSYEVVWNRAIAVFGGTELARDWMNTPLPTLADQTPDFVARSGDADRQREVLRILISIDYGMFN